MNIMKLQHFKFIIVSVGLTAIQLLSYAQENKTTKPIVYKLDVKQSKILWKGTKTVGTKHYGFLLFNSGSLNASPVGKLMGGSFNINMNTISSKDHVKQKDNLQVDEVLKSVDFFAVSQYSTASIMVKSITATKSPLQFNVQGNLTIKGIAHPIVFLATIKQVATRINANADFNIDRKRWGIHEQSQENFTDRLFSGIKDKMIGDEIPISLSLVFNRL
jgi:polyisoprenoid-binding protein YceI